MLQLREPQQQPLPAVTNYSPVTGMIKQEEPMTQAQLQEDAKIDNLILQLRQMNAGPDEIAQAF